MGECEGVRQAIPIPLVAEKTGLSAKEQTTPCNATNWNKRGNCKQTENR